MDSTFWVGISFCLFVLLLVYKKVPGIINNVLEGKIKEIKNKIEDAENLKKESNHLLLMEKLVKHSLMIIIYIYA